ncbi:IMP cyclohydrolase [Lactobacillus sp. DS15_6]|nr:IMP cyclohydrolase [Lacticaseibacillus paracasei]MBG1272505.1 IMP cyclohydrolase [Lacticaseibacillus paracasei subsp. paracasei]PTS50701.1 IMP cyclohydrolase [Lactobacillus sp. DS9_6]PTS62234.1 IMP cyclohydrolase [Lactobacillus sp. DS15_6]PTS70819.1 IMP cyclohydrolase [Lactobacillus sp. DS3_6]PTV41002.1 IMP cyclohydrolase [Lactobacillus sp. DS18_6]
MISRGHQSDVAVITRSPAQQPACKDLERNGQRPTITSKATYTSVTKRAGSRSVITRSPAQRPACKDPECNGPNPAITFRSTYTPVAKRAGSRSHKKKGRFDEADSKSHSA